jgi:hypothetical protein
MGERGIEPRSYDRSSGLAHARHRRRVRLGIGLVGQRQMSHEAHNADLPSPLPLSCACDQRVPLMYRAAFSGHAGVHVQVDPYGSRRGLLE